MDVGDALPDFDLLDPDGNAARLSAVLDERTMLILPRYYACLPCQHFMLEVNDRLDEFAEAGVSVAAVSAKTDYQARWLRDDQGITYPLLLDPEHAVFDALEIRQLKPWEMAKPSVLRRYIPAFTSRYVTGDERRSRQGMPADPFQLPGVVVVDADRTIVHLHRGEGLGDYPPIDELLESASKQAV